MQRSALVLVLLAVSTQLGCAMCCGPDDANYGAYGGRWQRTDMAEGRVGSVFTPVGQIVSDQVEVQEVQELEE
jgi:hypothetical protein